MVNFNYQNNCESSKSEYPHMNDSRELSSSLTYSGSKVVVLVS